MEAPTDPNGRLTALGNQLIYPEVHGWLREELARLREDVDAWLDGGGARLRELRAHCLTFCLTTAPDVPSAPGSVPPEA